MKTLINIALVAFAVIVIGCDTKDDNPLVVENEAVRFTTTNNVKTTPTYFSFDTGAATDSAGAWDVKLTYSYMLVDPSMPAIKYPFIALNAGRNVTAKMVDGTGFTSVNGSSATGLASDHDTVAVIGTNCLNYDGTTHRLNPYPDRTFVVQTGLGTRVKFAMVSYYNEASVSGYMTLDYVKY